MKKKTPNKVQRGKDKLMKYLPYLIIVLLIGWIVYDDTQDKAKLSQFETREDSLKTQLDSITALQHKTDLEALRLATSLNLAKESLAKQAITITNQRKRNEALKTVFSVPYVDSAALREIARLTSTN